MATDYGTPAGGRGRRKRKKPITVNPSTGYPSRPVTQATAPAEHARSEAAATAPDPDAVYKAAINRVLGGLGEQGPKSEFDVLRKLLGWDTRIHPLHREWADYQSYLTDLWPQVAPYLGQDPESEPPSAEPMTPQEASNEWGAGYAGGALTYVEPGTHDRVLYSPGTYLAPPAPHNRSAFSQTTPIHEWAHVYQDAGMPRMGMYEGGAEAFEQDVSGHLGLPDAESPRMYEILARRMRRRLGPTWVHGGQFE